MDGPLDAKMLVTWSLPLKLRVSEGITLTKLVICHLRNRGRLHR